VERLSAEAPDILAEIESAVDEETTFEEKEKAKSLAAAFIARYDVLLKPLGSAVAVGYAGGLWEDVSPAWLVGRNIGVQGFYLGRLMGLRPELVERAMGDVLRLWEGGAVRPVVGHELLLEEAGEAHRLIEERLTTGKVVLIP
jgi:NADPH:quinone reductase-like Zn-dependent oxidoreductase